MKVNLAVIAHKAGVSTASVSKALNNKSDISAATKKKIRNIAAELGYSCNFAARTLSTRRTCTIGIIQAFPHIPTVIERLKGVQDTAMEYGYVTSVSLHSGDPEDEKRQLSVLAGRVDGFIITPVDCTAERARIIDNTDMPLVQMSDAVTGLLADYAGGDDFEGGCLGAAHLLEQGARRISYFAGASRSSSDREIIRGIRSVLSEQGLSMKSGMVLRENTDKKRIRANVNSLLRKKNMPDAVFCFSDTAALWVMDSLMQQGISVPGDMLVLGYDNIAVSEIARVPLSTISQPNYEIGRNAMKMLAERLDPEISDQPPRKIIFPPRIISRNSTARTLRR